MVEKQMGNRLK